jgi:uncharacterized membrane protein YdcZ (DUF606 family)
MSSYTQNVMFKIILLFFIIVFLVYSSISDLKKKKSSTPIYVYIGGIGSSIFTLLYLLSLKLNFGADIQGYFILISAVFVLYIIITGVIEKLKSGDKEQIAFAKRALVFLTVSFILVLILVVDYHRIHT